MADHLELEQMEWLSGLDDADIERIRAASTRRKYSAGQMIVENGDTGRTMFFVLSGRVLAVQWTREGREIIYGDIGPGSGCGEVSVLTDEPRAMSLYARTDCLLSEIPGAILIELFETRPVVRKAVMRTQFRRVGELNNRVQELTLLGVDERLRSYLLRLALEQGRLGPGQELDLVPTQAEIAGIIGSHREAVSRALTALARQKVIETGRRYLRILDPDGLMPADME